MVSEHPPVVGRSSWPGWGYFLYQGVIDPLGGINSLWPLFGIANQLLAAVALCVATTILIKMGKLRYAWVTMRAAGVAGGRDADRRLAEGVLRRPEARASCRTRRSLADSTDPNAARMIFNDRLDAALALFFMAIVVVVIARVDAGVGPDGVAKRKAPDR